MNTLSSVIEEIERDREQSVKMLDKMKVVDEVYNKTEGKVEAYGEVLNLLHPLQIPQVAPYPWKNECHW